MDEEAIKLMDELRIERVKNGMDKKIISDARWSRAIAKGINQDNIFKSKLLNWPLEDE